MQSLKECLDKGSNTVRITGYAERLPEYIHEDLIQLSKNAALQMGANTIVMAEFNEKGRGTQSATFNAFLCNQAIVARFHNEVLRIEIIPRVKSIKSPNESPKVENHNKGTKIPATIEEKNI